MTKGSVDLGDGIVYTGQWRDNEQDGYGTMTWPDGEKYYEGMWRFGKWNGHGKYFYLSGATYEG